MSNEMDYEQNAREELANFKELIREMLQRGEITNDEVGELYSARRARMAEAQARNKAADLVAKQRKIYLYDQYIANTSPEQRARAHANKLAALEKLRQKGFIV